MRWRLDWSVQRSRIAIFVSGYQHCLLVRLYRHQIGEVAGEIAMIVSNRRDAEQLASFTRCFPNTSENKMEIEEREIDLLKQSNIDLIVLALHADLVAPVCGALPEEDHQRAHSFLPAFIGAKPYYAAFERGETDWSHQPLRHGGSR
jgi:formyltetrahydrofolate deformylase